MGSIFEDPARYEFFERTCNPQSGDGSTSIEVWEYHRNIAHARGKFMPVRELVERSSSASLRIIFAPLDRATRPYAADLLMLFRHFRVPSAFIDDNPRSVTLSFGASEDGAGGDCAWFHYLCKNITTHRSPANNQVYISGVLSGEPQFTQGDDSWILCKYFLRWDSGPESASAGQVTLICFGVPPLSNLRLRLSRLPSTWEEVLIDPYALFVIALDELSVQQDALVWGLNDIFRGMEVNALQSASMTNDRAMKGRHDFAGLHNVHKLIIYMSECSSAVMHTLTHLRERHREAMAGAQLQESSRKTMARTQGMLALVETRFETARLRVASLDRRMENLIGLSFHLVTQEGNAIMQRDSNSMATIAVVTLILLPISTTSTIFGSQFFDFDSNSATLRVSRNFWLFWAISLPVTVLILLLWTAVLKGRGVGGRWAMRKVNESKASG